ncbi:MAG: trypsin-like serine protease [Chitinophagaceae bacterium]|nr:trypsin-like serine protease [Oligoflexus sp.]
MKTPFYHTGLAIGLVSVLALTSCKKSQPEAAATPDKSDTGEALVNALVNPDDFAEGAPLEDATPEFQNDSLGLIGGTEPTISAISNVTIAISYINWKPISINQRDKLLVADSTASCTGMVVAPTLIITAGHCFKYINNPNAIVVYTGAGSDSRTGGKIGPSHAIARYGYKSTGQPTSHDFGYIILKRPITTKLIPIASPTELTSILKKGKQVYAVGYGYRDTNKTMSGWKGQLSDTILANSPADGLIAVGGAFYGTSSAQNLSSKHLCQGDSGGPLFAKTNTTKAWRLVGIVAAGDPNCKVGGTTYVALTKARVCWGVRLCQDIVLSSSAKAFESPKPGSANLYLV